MKGGALSMAEKRIFKKNKNFKKMNFSLDSLGDSIYF
jgi:hypothetical protein